MLRELAEVLEVLTAETPLVLVLEDLHWSDRSTVEFLTYVAQRRAPARLLVLGTYRPVETLIRAHPLRGIVQELCGRGQAVERRLELLLAEDVAVYVAGRLGGPVAAPLTAFIHARTEGNALFMVNIVEHLVQQGLVVRREAQWTLRQGAEVKLASLPEGLRQFLVKRIEDLPPETRRVLEAASVVGEAFAATAVAAGIHGRVEDVEACCEELAARHHLIEDIGLTVWPDATSSGGYRFQHALYQQVLYEALGTARRMQLHQRIGPGLEAGYGTQAGEIAAQLAVHFERGGKTPQAVHYWQQVGDNAARRNAHPEAIAALTKALALLASLPDSPERTRHELTLQLTLGELLMAAKGVAAPEAGDVYTRAHARCQQVAEMPQMVRALWGLIQFHTTQAQLHTAGELSQQLFDLAQRQPGTGFLLEGQSAMGAVAFYRGDFIAARSHLEQSLRLSDTLRSSTSPLRGGFVTGMIPFVCIVQTLWMLGYADQARERSQQALALARDVVHSPSLVLAEVLATLLCQFHRDMAATQAHADALMAFAAPQGFGLRIEQGRILRGWASAMLGDTTAGVAHIRQGLAASEGVGPGLYLPYFLSLLAEAFGQAGQPEAGLQALAEAVTLVATTQTRWWEAELYRLKGELLRQLPSPDAHEAEACFQQALDVARGQQAKSLELRAVMSLSRLWQQQGKRGDARELLAAIYSWFTQGFDTPDLQEARALLGELR
jgi:predicted ATPase